MLEVLLCDGVSVAERLAILRDRYGMMVTREIEEGVGDMCNLSDGVFRRGVEQGREEGREQGREEGRVQERARYLEAAASLVRDGVLALREASERLGFSEQELRTAL
jgi:flagellar biosynthesis/type III secretory pathway protein FliH